VKRKKIMDLKIAIAALLLTGAWVTADTTPPSVDYRYYALDGWLGAIGMPDDCFKCVVTATGRFSTEFGKSKDHQGVYPNPPIQNTVWI